MGIFGAIGKAFKAPLKPINKAVGAIPGINKVQNATPGLGRVGSALGIGPSPNVPQQMAPPIPSSPVPMGQGEPMTQAPPINPPSEVTPMPDVSNGGEGNQAPQMGANFGQQQNPQIGRLAQAMGSFGNQMMRPPMNPRQTPSINGGIGPNPQMMQRMMQQRQAIGNRRQSPSFNSGRPMMNRAPMM